MVGARKGVRTGQRPPLQPDAHKGDRGTVLVVAGSPGMFGAAILCATAAHRGGAGLVQVALPPQLQCLLPLAVPTATTLSRQARPLAAAVGAADAIVLGPGLGATAATRRLVQQVLRRAEVPVVLDADALNVLSPLVPQCLASRARLVLTPHPGEAARLLGVTTQAVQADRRAAVRALVARSGATVVLKGRGTLVAGVPGSDGVPAAACWQNRTGGPALATGGSGDVLAGLLAALLAQGLPCWHACCLAVAVHGLAGDRLARTRGRGLLASDLPLAIAEVLCARERSR